MFSLLCFCLFHSAPSPPTPTFLEYINNYRKINSTCTDIFLFSTISHSSFYSWNYLIYQKNIFQSILAWGKHFNILHVEGSSTQTWVPCRVGWHPQMPAGQYEPLTAYSAHKPSLLKKVLSTGASGHWHAQTQTISSVSLHYRWSGIWECHCQPSQR